MKRVYNFSAGPSMLPEEVLRKAADEMLNYHGSGQSVMEMSHRSQVYDSIIKGTEDILRQVMNIPENYRVLFLQGGATSQFAMVPLNLMTENRKADYVITGQFAEKAYKEACRYGQCRIAAKDKDYSCIPQLKREVFDREADYVHICMNNTVYGTAFDYIPDTGAIPLVADVSSCILSKPIDVSKFGILYAGAQKNMGIAGLTVVIIRDDLIGEPQEGTPTMFMYKTHAEKASMYNTPPCYSIYICKLVLEWIRDTIGGLETMEKLNREKASVLYDFLDSSKLFKGCAEKDSRSIMNVTFVTGDPDLDAKFVREAAAEDIVNIKGHRSVGGMRASIYNAMPREGVENLVEFMKKFEYRYTIQN